MSRSTGAHVQVATHGGVGGVSRSTCRPARRCLVASLPRRHEPGQVIALSGGQTPRPKRRVHHSVRARGHHDGHVARPGRRQTADIDSVPPAPGIGCEPLQVGSPPAAIAHRVLDQVPVQVLHESTINRQDPGLPLVTSRLRDVTVTDQEARRRPAVGALQPCDIAQEIGHRRDERAHVPLRLDRPRHVEILAEVTPRRPGDNRHRGKDDRGFDE
jgi:hypothetical protein